MNFGERLKLLRTKHNMKQKHLAELLNVSRATIGKYETSLASPDYEKIVALARIFKCSTDYFFGITEFPKSYSDSELNFFEKIFKLSLAEGLISANNALSEDDFQTLYEEIKTSFMAIKLLKRLPFSKIRMSNK